MQDIVTPQYISLYSRHIRAEVLNLNIGVLRDSQYLDSHVV